MQISDEVDTLVTQMAIEAVEAIGNDLPIAFAIACNSDLMLRIQDFLRHELNKWYAGYALRINSTKPDQWVIEIQP